MASVGMVDGELVPEAPRSDSILVNSEPSAHIARDHEQFYSEYRRQIEEALQTNADANKIRRRLEKVQQLNQTIQDGTYDPSDHNEGKALAEYQVWLVENEARLARVRQKHALKRGVHLDAPPSDKAASENTAPANTPTPEELAASLKAKEAADLKEMVDCHRELIELLSHVEVDEEEAPETSKLAAEKPLKATMPILEAPRGPLLSPKQMLLQGLKQAMQAQSGEAGEEDEEAPVIGVAPVKRQPKTERTNDWDREVYGVDEFDDSVLDDFEASFSTMMTNQITSTRGGLLGELSGAAVPAVPSSGETPAPAVSGESYNRDELD